MGRKPIITLPPELEDIVRRYISSGMCTSRWHPTIARYMLVMMSIDDIIAADPHKVTDMLVERGYCRYGVHIGKSRTNIRHHICRFQDYLRLNHIQHDGVSL